MNFDLHQLMKDLEKLYDDLLRFFGPQDWWPADSDFEMMIGAILTQNVSWGNVCIGIEALKDKNLIDPEKILGTENQVLHELIRPTGFFRQKTHRLKILSKAVIDAGGVDGFLRKESLRERLLEINGIGPETADSIVLYGGNEPHFVVDKYTMRILKRRYDIEGDYNCIQQLFHDSLKRDVKLYQEYHALLVRLAKEYCKKRPLCEGCPVSMGCGRFSVR